MSGFECALALFRTPSAGRTWKTCYREAWCRLCWMYDTPANDAHCGSGQPLLPSSRPLPCTSVNRDSEAVAPSRSERVDATTRPATTQSRKTSMGMETTLLWMDGASTDRPLPRRGRSHAEGQAIVRPTDPASPKLGRDWKETPSAPGTGGGLCARRAGLEVPPYQGGLLVEALGV